MKDWLLAALESLRFCACIVPFGWWKRWPFLPLPSKQFVEFRLHTAYGMQEHGWPRPPLWELIKDTKRFLLWRRRQRLLYR